MQIFEYFSVLYARSVGQQMFLWIEITTEIKCLSYFASVWGLNFIQHSLHVSFVVND